MEIILYSTNLMHDIDQWTFRLGNVHVADMELRDEAQSHIKERKTDASFYYRKVENAIGDMVMMMGDRAEKAETEQGDDRLKVKESWKVVTAHDEQYGSDAGVLAKVMHHYVVAHVMKHWCAIYAVDKMRFFDDELKGSEVSLRAALYTMRAPVKFRRKRVEYESTVTLG